MPDVRKIALSAVVIAVGAGTTSCSTVSSISPIPLLDGAATDNIAYRSSDATIQALAIPQELDKPAFNDAYTVSNTPVGGGGTSQAAQGRAGTVSTPPPRPAIPKVQVALSQLKTGEPMMAINAPLSSSWPWVGIALPQARYKVVKQQPAEGIYTVEYLGQPGESPGLLDQLTNSIDGVTFGGDPDRPRIGSTHLIVMSGNSAQQSFVFVADKNGKPARRGLAEKVLTALKEQFER